VVRHMLNTYAIGRDVQWQEAERALLSLVGPGAGAVADPEPPREEHAFVEGDAGLWVRTDLGVDLICSSSPDLGVDEVAEEVVECLRIESGRPRLGLDMDAETIPQEAGINERAVNFEKGCYVGQETVARLFYKGKPNRHLRGLRLAEPVGRGEPIRLGEREVGHVGSSTVSPTLGPIALAIVRREAQPGDSVQVGESGAVAHVVELPF